MRKLLVAAMLAAAAFPGAAVALHECVTPEDPVPSPERCQVHHTADCGYESFQQDDATGQNYEGVAYGYAAGGDGAVSVRCYVTVNGGEVASTTTGTGTMFATTSGRVTFAAEDTDVVQLCVESTSSEGVINDCFDSNHTQLPPQEVIDALDSIFDLLSIVDPLVCPVLAGLAGDYAGVVTINSQGDVFLAGEAWYDCPPYDLF